MHYLLVILAFMWGGLLAYLWYSLQRYNLSSASLLQSDMLMIIQKRDERIKELDADYKALVESYLRETGKVYVRPVTNDSERLQPPEPSPFRMKPPPPMPSMPVTRTRTK